MAMTDEQTDNTTTLATTAWFLTGPTASGKTAVGIELARLIDAEIVSMDSMALYRGLDLGTAKPTAQEQAAVPHHLIDVVEPTEDYSLARFVKAAHAAAADIASRGRKVLLVGGTPLYLKALLRGIFSGPPADWELRERLAGIGRVMGPEHLHAKLAEVDPAAAARLAPADTRRIIRALEVFYRTGQPISRLQQQFDRARPAADCKVFVLDWPRPELVRRIDARVDQMFATGLVDEVRGLLAMGEPLGRTAGKALGYRETIEHLHGERGLAETIALVKTHTRQFAKRQLTWLRSLSECRWVACSAPFDPERVAREIVEQAGAPG
jgi:tRNA dimethylallyltransferase